MNRAVGLILNLKESYMVLYVKSAQVQIIIGYPPSSNGNAKPVVLEQPLEVGPC